MSMQPDENDDTTYANALMDCIPRTESRHAYTRKTRLTGVADCEAMSGSTTTRASNKEDARGICERKVSLEPSDVLSDIVQDPPSNNNIIIIIDWARPTTVRTTSPM